MHVHLQFHHPALRSSSAHHRALGVDRGPAFCQAGPVSEKPRSRPMTRTDKALLALVIFLGIVILVLLVVLFRSF